MSKYKFKITYRNENEYGQYWVDKRYTVSVIAETLEQAKEKLDKIENNGMYKNILNWETEEIIDNEQLKSQLQQKENIIKEIKEEMENAKHISIDDSKAIVKHEKRLLQILDKVNNV